MRWLRADEGWAPSEEAVRLLGAVAIALVAIGLKLVIVRLLGGELGYLSYVGAVALAAWIAGSRGGVITTVICAIAEAGLFSGTLDEFLASPLTVFRFALFLFVGVLVTSITSHLRRVMVRERAARALGEERLRAQVAAYQGAERDRAALAGLQAVTASLAGAVTPGEVADAILDRGMMALGACAGGVSRLADDGQYLELIAARGYPQPAVAGRSHLDLAGRTHLRDAVVGGAPIFLTDPVAWAARYPESGPVPLPDSPTGGALAVLPLNPGGRTIGTVVFRFSSPEQLDGPTRDLAQRLADQGAQALDRALAFERERAVRETLERSGVRLPFLAETSELLASGVDVETTASSIPRLAVPSLADWCVVGLFDQDESLRSAAARNPLEEAVAERLAALAPRDIEPWLAARRRGRWCGGVDRRRPGGVAWGSGRGRAPRASWRRARCSWPGSAGHPRSDWAGSCSAARPRTATGRTISPMIRDVAGRVEVAAERSRLFAAVTRFKATVDVTEDAVYMFDPESLVLTYVNRGGADLVGFDESDLDGESVLRLQPEAHEATFRSRLAEVRRSSGRSGTYTGVMARRDGREIPVDARLQEVTLPDGVRTVILTARDISDRIEVQARLARIAGDERRKAAELQAVIRAMGEGVLVADPSGRITLANEAATSILDGDIPADLSRAEDRLQLGPRPEAEPAEGADLPAPVDDAEPRTVRLERRPLARDRHLLGGARGRGHRGVPRLPDRRAPRRDPGSRGRGRPRGVPRRAVARAADPCDHDLRLGQGAPAAGPQAGPGRDARRHRGGGGSPVPDRGGPAGTHPGGGRDPRRR